MRFFVLGSADPDTDVGNDAAVLALLGMGLGWGAVSSSVRGPLRFVDFGLVDNENEEEAEPAVKAVSIGRGGTDMGLTGFCCS